MATSWSATLSSSSDAGLVLADLGSRFSSCQYTTNLNAGFDQMSTTLCMPGGSKKIPIDFAGEVFRDWRGMIARVFIEGTLAWAGRMTDISIHDYDPDGGCAVDLGFLGFAHDLERERPDLDASYADEFATTSASQLVRTIVDQSASPIAKRYVNVQETAVNIGPVSVGVADSSLSLILNQLKGASTDGVEFTFLVWDPADGPYLVPTGVGPTRYQLRMADAPGTALRWSLSEYVSDTIALFTNEDGTSDASETATAADGSLLNGGLRSFRSLSVDAITADGAAAARDAFLALHKDPHGVSGSFVVHDFIRNDEGGHELAGLVRAGDIVSVPDVLPFDPLLTRDQRTWAIASTSYDVFTRQLSVTLDQRAIESRENERMTDVRVQQRLTEPGANHSILLNDFVQFSTNVAIPTNTNTLVNTDPFSFTMSRNARIYVEIQMDIHDAGTGSGSTADATLQVGCTIDEEDWDFTDPKMMSRSYFRTGLATADVTISGHPKPRALKAGAHRINFWIRDSAGSYEVSVLRFRVQG